MKKILKSKFFKDVSITTGAKLFSVIITFVLKIVVARLLTKEEFGTIAVLTSISTYFGMIAHFATNAITQRNIVENIKDYQRHYYIYINTKLITLSISTVLFIITAYVLGYFKYDTVLILVILNMMLGAVSSIPKIILESFEDFRSFAKVVALTAVVSLLLQSVLLYYYRSAEALMVAILITSTFSVLSYYWMIKNKLGVTVLYGKSNLLDVKNLLIAAFPLFVGNFFYLLYYRIDTVMIEKMIGVERAGEYSIAFNMSDQIIDMIWVQFIIVFYPRMVRLYDESKPKLVKIIQSISCVLICVFFTMFSISYFISADVFSFVFGDGFRNSGDIFTWSMVSGFFICLFSLYYRVLIISGKQRVYLYAAILAALMNVVLNYTLIPIFGPLGAIYSSCVVNSIIFLIVYFLSMKVLRSNA